MMARLIIRDVLWLFRLVGGGNLFPEPPSEAPPARRARGQVGPPPIPASRADDVLEDTRPLVDRSPGPYHRRLENRAVLDDAPVSEHHGVRRDAGPHDGGARDRRVRAV